MRENIVHMAKKNSKEIIRYIQANYKKGDTISKRAIRIKFNLPYNRASTVFGVLESKGYIITHRTILVQ
jgi:predicted transcriptional regulator